MIKPKQKAIAILSLAHSVLSKLVVAFFFVALTGVFLYTRVSAPTHVSAAVPATLNFQSRLLNASGSIVPDGTYNVEFKIFNALTSSGSAQGSCAGDATCLWTETRLTTDATNLKVTLRGGYMSVYLGDKTALPSNIWDQQLYLSMNIGGTPVSPTWDGEMSPRLRLTSVPYAFQAAKAGQLQQLSGANTGNLTFNGVTTNPDIKLPDIAGTNNVLLQSGTTLFTQGSVPFTDSTGRLTQNNANLFYDGTNNTLGVGSTRAGAIDGTGNSRLVIQGAGSTSATSSLNIRNSGGTGSLFLVRDDGNVGIGATTFGANGLLQVNGDIGLTGNRTIRQSTNADGNTLTVLATQLVAGNSNSNGYGYVGGGQIASVSPAGGALLLDVGGNVAATAARLKVTNDGTGVTGTLTYGTPSSSTLYANSATGNIGIGTTTIGTNNRLIVNAYSTVDNLATAQINTNAAANKGLVIQGFASQSADLLQIQNSAGALVNRVTSNGRVFVASAADGGETFKVKGTASGGVAFAVERFGSTDTSFGFFENGSASLIALPATAGTTSQSSPVFNLISSYWNGSSSVNENVAFSADRLSSVAGGFRFGISTPDGNRPLTLAGAGGSVSVGGGQVFPTSTSPSLTVQGISDRVSQLIKGSSGQTADLLQIQNNAGTSLAVVSATGSVGIGTSGVPSQPLSVGGSTGNFTVSSAGAVVGVGVNSGTGLIQGTGGLAITGSASFLKGADYSTIGSTNDVVLGAGSLFRLTGASAQTITGIAGGTDGRIVQLVNAAANPAVLSNQSVSSAAANRISTGTGADLTLAAGSSTELVYDSGASLWRVVGVSGSCTTCANQQLSNLSGTVAINIALLTAGDNLIDLGSAANSFRTLYADTSVLSPTVDTATAVTLNLGTATASAVSLGRSGITTTNNGALTVSQALTANGSVSVTGANTLTVNSLTTTGTLAVGSATVQGGVASITGSGGAGQSLEFDSKEIKFRGDGFAHYSLFNSGGVFSLNNTGGSSNTGTVGTPLLSIGTTGNATFAGTIQGTTIDATTGINTGAGAGTLRLDSAGALSNISTLNLSGAITGATATNTINGLIINGGAVSGATTISASGALTAVGVNSGTGVLQGSGGLTITGTSSLAATTISSTLGVTGAITGSSTVQGTQLISTIATGTAPLTVTSTTRVNNLNAELFDSVTSYGLAERTRAQSNLSGGGTVSWVSTNLKWTSRFIVIANGQGTHFSTNGYFDINQPTTGTITGVGGASNVTATASGIPLAAWTALYYILPVGSNSTSIDANFRVATYTGALQVPSDWILIAVHNGDNASVRTGIGVTLRSGGSYTPGLEDAYIANSATLQAATFNINGTGTVNNLVANTGLYTGASAGTLRLDSAGALSNITGYSQASGNFLQSGVGSFSTGTGAVSLNGATSVSGVLAVGGAGSNTSAIAGDIIVNRGGASPGTGAIYFGNANGTHYLYYAGPYFSLTDPLNVTGTVTGVGLNSGTGLIQGTGGLTLTGVVSVTNNGANTLGLNTGTSSGQISIGGGTAPLAIDSTAFDVSTAGALSGITGYAQVSGNFSQTGTGTFATGTGLVGLNGNVTINTGSLTTGTNTDLTVTANGTGVINLNDDLNVGSGDLVVTNSTGYVGIGQPSPSRPLHISSSAVDVANGSIQLIDGSFSSTANSQYGVRAVPNVAPSGALGGTGITYTGIQGSPVSNSVNLGTASNIIGVNGAPYIYGTAVAPNVYGAQFVNYAADTATITNSIGLSVNTPNKAAGATITNNTGLRVDAQNTATNNIGIAIGEATGTNQTNLVIGQTNQPSGTYSIYNSSADQNYFGGNLGIGVLSPTAALQIQSANGTSGVTGTAGVAGLIVNTGSGGNSSGAITQGGAGGAISLTAGNGGNSTGVFGANGGNVTLQGGGGGTGTQAGSYGNILLAPSGGYVGIGLSTPTSTLQVQSPVGTSAGATTMSFTSGTTTFTTSAPIVLNAGDYIVPNTNSTPAIESRVVRIGGSGTSFTVASAFINGLANTSFTIYRPVANFTHSTGSSALVVQGSTGNIGVGVVAPSATLHVVGSNGAASTGSNYLGQAAPSVLQVVGGTGGAGGVDTSPGFPTAGGAGAALNLQGGAGGNGGAYQSAAGPGASGGAGGSITIQGGAGGVGGSGSVSGPTGAYGTVSLNANGGNVGIGTSTPASILELSKSASGALGPELTLTNPGNAVGDSAAITFKSGADGRSRILQSVGTGVFVGDISLQSKNSYTDSTYTTRVFIEGATGKVGISNNAPGYLLHVGSASIATGTAVARFQNAGGTCTVTPNVAAGITCTSDRRLKKDITNYSGNALDAILGLQTVNYRLNAESDTDQSHVGFIAQDFQQLFPDLTTTDKEGFLSVSYGGLTPYLAKAIQQQQGQINALANGSSQNINVSGTATINNLVVTGTASLKDLKVTGAATIGILNVVNAVTTKDLTVTGTATIEKLIVKDIEVTGGLVVKGGITTAIAQKKANYTAVLSDSIITADASAGNFTVTLPTAVGIAGRQFTVKKTDTSANPVIVNTTSTVATSTTTATPQTIDGAATYNLPTPYRYIVVVSDGTNWIVVGNN